MNRGINSSFFGSKLNFLYSLHLTFFNICYSMNAEEEINEVNKESLSRNEWASTSFGLTALSSTPFISSSAFIQYNILLNY